MITFSNLVDMTWNVIKDSLKNIALNKWYPYYLSYLEDEWERERERQSKRESRRETECERESQVEK